MGAKLDAEEARNRLEDFAESTLGKQLQCHQGDVAESMGTSYSSFV